MNNSASNETTILISGIATPLGEMIAGATDDGLCLLEFADRPELQAEIDDLMRLLNASVLNGSNAHIIQAKTELGEYFAGKRKQFDLQLITPGSDFKLKVWNSLKEIPYGTMISYQQQSENMESPDAIRAIAHANGCNRISIIIPCHRVIGKSGKLTGYGGGIERKRWLLNHEGQYSNLNVGLFSLIGD